MGGRKEGRSPVARPSPYRGWPCMQIAERASVGQYKELTAGWQRGMQRISLSLPSSRALIVSTRSFSMYMRIISALSLPFANDRCCTRIRTELATRLKPSELGAINLRNNALAGIRSFASTTSREGNTYILGESEEDNFRNRLLLAMHSSMSGSNPNMNEW